MQPMIRHVDHVALPYLVADTERIRAFWNELGLDIDAREVTEESYDHAGARVRLHVTTLNQHFVSYFPVDLPADEVRRLTRFGHVAFEIYPGALPALRRHPTLERETRWGPGHDSLFIEGPYGLRVELVARGVV